MIQQLKLIRRIHVKAVYDVGSNYSILKRFPRVSHECFIYVSLYPYNTARKYIFGRTLKCSYACVKWQNVVGLVDVMG
jgi:hypothetical protein